MAEDFDIVVENTLNINVQDREKKFRIYAFWKTDDIGTVSSSSSHKINSCKSKKVDF